MIEPNGVLRLYDYGLCVKKEEASIGTAHVDHIEGSPFYLPPERVVGAPEGEYSEIYSLGMVLFHMLAGKTYYSESEINDLVSKHISSLRISSVSTHLRHCNQRTIQIVDKMIKRRPNDRYHSFDGLRSDLEALIPLLGELRNDVFARNIELPPEAAANLIQAKKKNLKKKAIVAGVVAAVAIFAVIGWRVRSMLREKKIRAETRLQVSKSLSVSPDIENSAQTESQIKELVKKSFEENFAKEEALLAKFNEASAKNDALKTLHLSLSPASPPKTLSELDKDIKKEKDILTEKQRSSVNRNFDPDNARSEVIARKGLKEPLEEPKLPLGEAAKSFDEYLKKQVDEKFSVKILASRLTAIYNEYGGYRVGQFVKTTDAAALPVSGIFQWKKGGKVSIGGREILLDDIPHTERWKFNELACEKKTAVETDKVKVSFEKEKSKYAAELKKKEEDTFYRNLGYLKNDGGKYVSAKELTAEDVEKIKNEFEAKIKRKDDEIKQNIEKNFDVEAFYRKNGYCKVEGQWISHADALVKIVNQKRNSFNSDRNNKLAPIRGRLQKEIEKKIYTENNYVFYEEKWQAARPLIDRIVEEKIKSK
jgi:serine/threonine protein kinase